VLFGCGSGMTVKFFPLFFLNDLQLSPVAVQGIFMVMPLGIASSSSVGLRLARCIGRVQTMVLLKSLSIAMLLAIGAIGHTLREEAWQLTPTARPEVDDASAAGLTTNGGLQRRPLLVLLVTLLYLLRQSCANCTMPLSTALSMDYVPSTARARWSSLHGLVQACWSGSAAIGGWLADAHGYAALFQITAAIHVLGTLLQALLLPIVPRREL
jgi:MFS family permease